MLARKKIKMLLRFGASRLVQAVALILCAIVTASCGQEEVKPLRIGIVLGVNTFKNTTDSFKQTFLERGYVEGQTIVFDEVAGNADQTRMNEACARFAREKVDLVFATTNGGAGACKKALSGTDIPMVFAIVMAPLESGIVDSLAAPSGNVTGIRNGLSDFVGKRIEILLRLAPDVKRIWIPITSAYPTTKHFLPPVKNAAKHNGVELDVAELDTPDKIISHLQAIPSPTFDAIMLPPNPAPQANASFGAIMDFAKKHALPVIGNSVKNLEPGCLFSYHIDNKEEGRIAAMIAAKILTDEKRIPYPVINSEPVLHINAKAAKRLGLTINNDMRAFGEVLFEQ